MPIGSIPKDLKRALETFHAASTANKTAPFLEILRLISLHRLDLRCMVRSEDAWDLLTAFYQRGGHENSFTDFFWTWRSSHLPLFNLLATELPPARVYHPISTGYAGFLGVLGKVRQGGALVLTEHGIYVREREIEITQAEWIYTESTTGSVFTPTEHFFKSWWVKIFRFLSQVIYDSADRIVTLHGVNQSVQVAAGAPPEKIDVVPNGLNIARYDTLPRGRDWHDRPFRVGLIGRVVPIKDVKTFIRAIKIVSGQLNHLEVFIVGPTDEDPAYHNECRLLVDQLELGDTVVFTGRANVMEFYPRLDLVVLTSISESQPLVILEAAGAGLPVVTTDVGACSEMLFGRPGEDAGLGAGGIVTPVASPSATAQAIVELWANPTRWAEMAEAANERLRRFYGEDKLFAYYRKLYAELASLTSLVALT